MKTPSHPLVSALVAVFAVASLVACEVKVNDPPAHNAPPPPAAQPAPTPASTTPAPLPAPPIR